MSELRFEWDPAKAASNLRKHGISFEDAQGVFYDEHGLLLDDPDHSAVEERFILLGLSEPGGVLVVVHCYRRHRDVIRLISSRRASRRERERYAQGWKP